MNFCSHCGSNQLDCKVPAGDHVARYVCQVCGTVHYVNPKMVVGCLVVHEERVLLCRRAIEPRYGFWNLPTGFLESGETVEEGAIRETWEEARARVKVERLHSVYSLPHCDQIIIHFVAQLQETGIEAGPESLEVNFFAETEIPWDDMAFSSHRFALERYFENRLKPDKQTYLGSSCLRTS
ncbi:ADP-ribose pyrophosphatase YjhB, NUDIX family [Catalinimonas alkaloidigena]|uniref:ADP-ribose pyrophosphatase YjhB, NUDIX family n=1 Tax=Catalinimonas alkaloidigena TaxID=1075417 RepID=A0A1G9BG11_9BACT|nr:NUDIX hydrolase [Catalinimonas alkaloidigena]SDK37994.1 ADP-ribose pyrophosphatase YjhB, NUDIX family [Catalinimonas alkaloidigena]